MRVKKAYTAVVDVLPLETTAAVPRTSPGFLDGLLLPVRAAGLLVRTPGLLAWTLACWLVTAATMVLSGILLWRLVPQLPIGWDTLPDWLSGVARGLVFLLLFLVALLTVPHLVLAPLQDPLSEAVSAAASGSREEPRGMAHLLRTSLLGLAVSLGRILVYLIGWLPLFVAQFVPAIGALAAGTLVLWTALWLSVEYVSGPMARELLGLRATLTLLAAHKGAALGLGLSLQLMLWIPLLNFFLMPVAVAAGTLFWLRVRPVTSRPVAPNA